MPAIGFRWDADKDASNQAKHHHGFRQAVEVFRSFRLTVEDTRRPYGERRFVTLGTYDGEVLRVVHTLRWRHPHHLSMEGDQA